MKARNVILLLMCVLLLVLPLLCAAHIVEHGCTMCGSDAGEPMNYPADPCETLVRIEELGELPPPLMALPSPASMLSTQVWEEKGRRIVWARIESAHPQLAYPPSDTPLRI